MSRYAVALQLVKQMPGDVETTSIRLNVVEAVSVEEAIGKEFLAIKSPDYRIGAYRAMEITECQTKTTTMKNIFELVQQWVRDRNLHTQDPKIQLGKVMEELGETAKAIMRIPRRDPSQKPSIMSNAEKENWLQIKDGIGDTMVTLICLAEQCRLDAETCLEIAYEEIKDRKGKLIDGVFVKEEDLGNG